MERERGERETPLMDPEISCSVVNRYLKKKKEELSFFRVAGDLVELAEFLEPDRPSKPVFRVAVARPIRTTDPCPVVQPKFGHGS